MKQLNPIEPPPEITERVEITGAQRAEIAKLDPQLEGRVGRAHELGLVEPEPFNECPDVRQRCLAHPDNADFLGFDQLDRTGKRKMPYQRRRSHPPSGSPADDDDPATGWQFHC